jgi:DNA-binding transcriptional ArsR family regulator
MSVLDKTRIEILQLLIARGEASAQQIAAEMNLTMAAVTGALVVLRKKGLSCSQARRCGPSPKRAWGFGRLHTTRPICARGRWTRMESITRQTMRRD